MYGINNLIRRNFENNYIKYYMKIILYKIIKDNKSNKLKIEFNF